MKTTLSELQKGYLCRSKYGYIDLDCIEKEFRILSGAKDKSISDIEAIDRIIVKRRKFNSSKIREILTGTKLDVVEMTHVYRQGIYIPIKTDVKGNKDELSTFVLIPTYSKSPTLYELQQYCESHPNEEEYRSYLSTLISSGEKNKEEAKKQEVKNAKEKAKKIELLLSGYSGKSHRK